MTLLSISHARMSAPGGQGSFVAFLLNLQCLKQCLVDSYVFSKYVLNKLNEWINAHNVGFDLALAGNSGNVSRTRGGTNLVPWAERGISQYNGRWRGVYKSHTDRSHLLSAVSGKMLCSLCSISYPPNGLCEPGKSWVLNECLLRIVICWGRNDFQVTERNGGSEKWCFSL